MSILLIIAIVLSTAYFVIVGLLIIGWNKITISKKKNTSPNTQVSVVIPFRDEENNIENCLNDIINQNYPNELYEVIIIDDNSTDNSVEIANKIIESGKANIRLLRIEDRNKDIPHKKQAIEKAIEVSSGDLIICTDSDCRFKTDWILTIAGFYEKDNYKMICGPVSFNTKTFFDKIQALEFASLIGATGGAIGINKPIMSNGANLAFSKEAFIEVDGFKGNSEISSGDDVFLMHKLKEKYSNGIGFIKSKEAIVYTNPQPSLKSFINQRLRWAGKSKKYTDAFTILVSFIILLFNLLVLFFIAKGIYNNNYYNMLSLLLIKSIPDFIMLFKVSSFNNQKKLMWLFPIEQILYILYVPIIGLLSMFWKSKWKGREVRV